ncbi:MAG: hypothetical protein CMP38_03555 [Rickettsiales bacterium]|nr:hypothetical protein [Rickettsiales bacterium]|tara:strand:- start:2191 stop:2655 length:465 start_codon:yes stop_codon:yes gene_type:complete
MVKKKNFNIFLLLIFFFFCSLTFSKGNFDETSFLIVVNSENSYKNEIDKGLRKIQLIYKGNSKEWPGNLKATFFSRGDNNPVQIEFYRKILNMNLKEVNTFWESKASRGIYKPNSIENIRDLINEISRNKGAVSIISRSEMEKIPAMVRVLYEF